MAVQEDGAGGQCGRAVWDGSGEGQCGRAVR